MRALILLPLVVLLASSLVLAIAGIAASGAASVVRYPDNVPVYAGLFAAVPSMLFGLVALAIVWKRTSRPFAVRVPKVVGGLVGILAVVAMLLAYAVLVGDPDHYKGQFNNATQEWEPSFDTYRQYLAAIFGVATTVPMGVLGIIIKIFYIDSIQVPQLDQPEGLDPIGSIMSGAT